MLFQVLAKTKFLKSYNAVSTIDTIVHITRDDQSGPEIRRLLETQLAALRPWLFNDLGFVMRD